MFARGRFACAALATLLTMFGCARAPSHGAHAPQLPPPLARFHEATGGARWGQVQGITSSGRIEIGGLSGPYHRSLDVQSGRYRSQLTLGANQAAEGYDGQHEWSQDFGGEVVSLDSAEAVALARTHAWLTRRGYFDDEGVHYHALGERTVDGRVHDVVEARPEAGVAIELWLDRDTGLLARTVHRDGKDVVTSRYEDYRDIGGVRIPFREVFEREDERQRVTIELASAALRGAFAASDFAPPATDEDRMVFVGDVQRSDVPFDLLNNHIYVHGSVDGKPVRFLVDTGGVNLLTPAAARRLGLAPEGKLAAQGVGKEKIDLGFAKARELRVGDVQLRDPVFYVVDLGALPDVEGEDLDGLVGFEFFHRLAVRIDYPAGKLTLSPPASFVPPPGATALPFQLRDRIPIIAGSIDGLAATFTVDTGSRSSVTPHAPFVRKHDLVGRYRPRFEAVTGWGVGGPVSTRPVRFAEVTLGAGQRGSVTLRQVAGDLFVEGEGAFNDPDASANLGGALLRRFVVSFDYRGRTMYLEPGPRVAAPDPYDRLGMFLLRDGDALRVAAITPTGPAEKAGLRVGDRVLAIDGTNVRERHLAAWRVQLSESAPGGEVRLTLERGGARSEVSVMLEELLP